VESSGRWTICRHMCWRGPDFVRRAPSAISAGSCSSPSSGRRRILGLAHRAALRADRLAGAGLRQRPGRAQHVETFERVADGLHIPGALLELAAAPWNAPPNLCPTRIRRTESLECYDATSSNSERRSQQRRGRWRSGILRRPVETESAAPRGSPAQQLSVCGADDHLGGADTFHLYIARSSDQPP